MSCYKEYTCFPLKFQEDCAIYVNVNQSLTTFSVSLHPCTPEEETTSIIEDEHSLSGTFTQKHLALILKLLCLLER